MKNPIKCWSSEPESELAIAPSKLTEGGWIYGVSAGGDELPPNPNNLPIADPSGNKLE